MKTKKTISIFIPHVGCPHDCVFCNQVKITGSSTSVTGDEIKKIIETQIKTIDENILVEVAFFGGSFTAIEPHIQEEFLQVAYEFIKAGKVSHIRISTRPDAIDNEILSRLKKYGVKVIELGVQSLDREVLIHSERGHDDESVYKSSKLIMEYGFELGLQMMVGLPKDTMEKSIETANKIAEINPQFVRIYPVLVLEDTKLADMFREGSYMPITVENAVDIVSKLINIFKINNIDIIRVGLQNSEEISLDGSAIGGPFHPSLGELCYSRYYRNKIEDLIDNRDIREVRIYCPKKLVSKFIGNKKSNKEYFANKNINMNIISWDKNKTIIEIEKEQFSLE